MSDLLKIAERCESATGSDRELDCAIYNAVPDGENRKAERLPMERWGDRFDDGWRTMWADREDKYCEPLKRYTSSVDAALTLVPFGWTFDLVSGHTTTCARLFGPTRQATSVIRGRSPALAICAAALRARATRIPQEKDSV